MPPIDISWAILSSGCEDAADDAEEDDSAAENDGSFDKGVALLKEGAAGDALPGFLRRRAEERCTERETEQVSNNRVATQRQGQRFGREDRTHPRLWPLPGKAPAADNRFASCSPTPPLTSGLAGTSTRAFLDAEPEEESEGSSTQASRRA
jgi:hypothetical protein